MKIAVHSPLLRDRKTTVPRDDNCRDQRPAISKFFSLAMRFAVVAERQEYSRAGSLTRFFASSRWRSTANRETVAPGRKLGHEERWNEGKRRRREKKGKEETRTTSIYYPCQWNVTYGTKTELKRTGEFSHSRILARARTRATESERLRETPLLTRSLSRRILPQRGKSTISGIHFTLESVFLGSREYRATSTEYQVSCLFFGISIIRTTRLFFPLVSFLFSFFFFFFREGTTRRTAVYRTSFTPLPLYSQTIVTSLLHRSITIMRNI